MEDKEPVKRSRSRSRSPLPRKRGGRRYRSRSPRGIVSSDTQRHETHLKRGRIFVGNIDPESCKRKDLLDTFSRYGEVLAVSIHSGYAFVQMESEKSANSAVNLEHGRMFNGKKINVEFSSAAIKAGAKFQPLSLRSSRSPGGGPPLPPPPSHLDSDAEAYLEQERRVARIMALENELQNEVRHFQRSRIHEYDYYSSKRGGPSSDYPPHPPPSHSLPSSYHSGNRPMERSSRDYERDVRPKPPPARMDYYDLQRPPQSPSRGAGGINPTYSIDYPEREVSSLYTRGGGASGYSREWETPAYASGSYSGGGNTSMGGGKPSGSW